MKRRDLVRELVDAGCYFNRHGKKHDIYVNPKNGKKAPLYLGTLKSLKSKVVSSEI